MLVVVLAWVVAVCLVLLFLVVPVLPVAVEAVSVVVWLVVRVKAVLARENVGRKLLGELDTSIA